MKLLQEAKRGQLIYEWDLKGGRFGVVTSPSTTRKAPKIVQWLAGSRTKVSAMAEFYFVELNYGAKTIVLVR